MHLLKQIPQKFLYFKIILLEKGPEQNSLGNFQEELKSNKFKEALIAFFIDYWS